MAGLGFVTIDDDLHTQPKFRRMVAHTGGDVLRTMGGLVMVWAWVRRELTRRRNGSNTIEGLAIDDVDLAAGLEGFGKAMLTVGWVRETDDGIEFPGFREHRRKVQTALRQERYKAFENVTERCKAFESVEKRCKALPESESEKEKDIPPLKPPPGGGRRLRRVEKPEDLV